MEPPGCPPDQLSRRSPNFACVRCWKLKKKCDKLSPKCSRCAMCSVSCIYSAQPPTGRVGHLQSRANNVVAVSRPSTQNDAAYASSVSSHPKIPYLVLPGLFQLSAQGYLSIRQNFHPCFDTRSAVPIYTIFNAVRNEIENVCALYLRTTNSWLPIITDVRLHDHLAYLGENPDPEIYTLILCIYLVTQAPAYATEEGTNLESLYSILKPFYSSLQSMSMPSIPILQAGMLLAVYEQGQALDQLGYLSIGTCARMGHAMGLQKTLQQDLSSAGADRAALEERKHVWWCVVILERILALENTEASRPFASKDPSLDDYLPSFCASNPDSDIPIPIGKATKTGSNFPEIIFPPTNPYGRTAQATYLLAHVFKHTENRHEDSEARHSEAEYLDKTLQVFLLSTLEQGNLDHENEWHHSCGAYFLCICALFALHKYNLSIDSLSNQQSPANQSFPQKSLLALRTLSRIGIGSAKSNMGELFLESCHIPPFALHYFRDAALFSMGMGYEDGNKIQWIENWKYLSDYLSVASRKWRLARKHLDTIESTVANQHRTRAVEWSSVRH